MIDYDKKLDRIIAQIKAHRAVIRGRFIIRYRADGTIIPNIPDGIKLRRLLRAYRRLVEIG